MSSLSAQVATIISNTMLAFNKGSDHGVKVGDVASVQRIVEILDPVTHEKLGGVSVSKLALRVNHVQGKLCTAAVTSLQDEDSPGPVTRIRKLVRIVNDKVEEKAGIKVYVKVGDLVLIEVEDKFSDEPPF